MQNEWYLLDSRLSQKNPCVPSMAWKSVAESEGGDEVSLACGENKTPFYTPQASLGTNILAPVMG